MDSATLPPWPAPPPSLRLVPGYAQVFAFSLDLDAQALATLRGMLDDAERARADRYLHDASRRSFTAARGQLRRVLGWLLGLPPAEIRFAAGPRGKPSLLEGDLRFNLSHSGGLALLAVTLAREIGVDIEDTTRSVDYANMARRFFAPAEAQALAALPAADQPRAFFDCWTRKEAYIKARGLGLTISLDSFVVTFGPGETPRFVSGAEGWTLYPLDPGPGYAAALVVEGEVEGIECWWWE